MSFEFITVPFTKNRLTKPLNQIFGLDYGPCDNLIDYITICKYYVSIPKQVKWTQKFLGLSRN